MSARPSKPTKPAKPQNATPPSSRSTSSSLSSHLAMVELKQKILTSLSKLADRDTHQIAVEDLESTIQSLSPETLTMILNCLYDSCNEPKPAVKKESIRLLSFVCKCHGELTAAHLTKIISQIVKRLKDSDSGVRDACRDAIGALAEQYLKGKEESSLMGLFVKPLFEAMGDQNKGVQSGAAVCMTKMVESATEPPLLAFQKLCPRICKLLNNSNFVAKASLLPVVASLSQVGAIGPQTLEPLLESIHQCLRSADWTTRKAAADALSVLALHSSKLIMDKADSTLVVLEACRFDKIKPVRESISEALQLWKKIAGKSEESMPNEQQGLSHEESESKKNGERRSNLAELLKKDPSDGSSNAPDSASKGKTGSIPEKAVVILKKKAPALSDKELNPEFFQKLETRGSGDLPVEVVVPRRLKDASNSSNDEESDLKGRSNFLAKSPADVRGIGSTKTRNLEADEHAAETLRTGVKERETPENHSFTSNTDSQSEGSFMNNKGNWSAIQRQLLQLERQQAHLMKMLKDFMGGSHDSMVTLENRVRGLERIVEDMAADLSASSGRRGNHVMGFDGSNRPPSKQNGFFNYSIGKHNGVSSGMRGRAWRSSAPDDWDFSSFNGSRNGQVSSRRSPKAEHETEHISSNRRAWDKSSASIRLGEGPSARSVWQASKDEATLEAIRVAGDDTGPPRLGRMAVPEAEAMGDDNAGQDRDPIWTSWSNAMHSLRVGDMDTAYAEVLSTADDHLLIKLMDRTGPALDQLSNEIANEALNAIVQFLLDLNLFDICLSWIHQLLEMVMENGPDVFGVDVELRKELLLNLHDASSTMDPPEDWEGPMPDQLLMQLASAWGVDLQQFEKR